MRKLFSNNINIPLNPCSDSRKIGTTNPTQPWQIKLAPTRKKKKEQEVISTGKNTIDPVEKSKATH